MVVPINDGSHNPRITISSPPRPTAPPAEPQIISSSNLPNDNIVTFLVTQNNNSGVVKCERKAIIESDTELSKIITGSGRKVDGNFVINEVDIVDFESFVRYLETGVIHLRNMNHCLKMMEIATRLECRNLTKICSEEIDLKLDTTNVIEVFHHFWYYKSVSPASPQPVKKKPKKGAVPLIPITSEEYVSALLNNSLQLIDMEANTVLQSDEVLDLRFEELEIIVKRDTLQLKSEMILFDLLAKWSLRECERKKIEINGENRRRVLGALCYTPRYMNMSSTDFNVCCNRVQLLDDFEINLIQESLKGKVSTSCTAEQRDMLNRFKRPRPPFAQMPIRLSQRSDPKNYPKKMRQFNRNDDETCCLNCISIIACIFD